MLELNDLEAAQEYVARLEAFFSQEPIALVRLAAARGRALIAVARGRTDPQLVRELESLAHDAREAGLLVACRAIDAALASLRGAVRPE
jgi:hypothetical protein